MVFVGILVHLLVPPCLFAHVKSGWQKPREREIRVFCIMHVLFYLKIGNVLNANISLKKAFAQSWIRCELYQPVTILNILN